VKALKKDKRRRFSQTEMYYFERWWNLQKDTVKEEVRQLVSDG